MAKEQKDITTLDVQIAEFIRSHKKSGTATDDEINDQLVIPFTLDADGIDDLLQRGIAWKQLCQGQRPSTDVLEGNWGRSSFDQ